MQHNKNSKIFLIVDRKYREKIRSYEKTFSTKILLLNFSGELSRSLYDISKLKEHRVGIKTMRLFVVLE